MPLSYDARIVFSLFSMKYMGSCPLNRKAVNYNPMAATLTFIKVIHDLEGDGGQSELHMLQLKVKSNQDNILNKPTWLELLFQVFWGHY